MYKGFKSRELYLEYNKKYNKNRPKKDRKDVVEHREYTAQWYRDQRKYHPEKMMLKKARERANQKGLPFNLSKEDILIPDTCPVLNIPIMRQEGKCSDNSPVLDRIDNNKGYVKGNVMVISHRANRIKSDATAPELFAIYCYMKNAGQPTCS